MILAALIAALFVGLLLLIWRDPAHLRDQYRASLH